MPSEDLNPAGSATGAVSSADLAPAQPHPYVAASRVATLAGLVALVALCLAWELWLAPTGSGTLALKALPLVLCIAGLWRHRMYTYRWLAMLVWLYFLEGSTRIYTDSGISQMLALGEIVLSIYLFACSSFYIRWRLRQGRALQAAAAAAAPASAPASPGPSATARP